MRLEDLGLIGNCQFSALIHSSGEIVWCCLPRFDSEPVCSTLLDNQDGGHFRIGPASGETGSQRYMLNTNILETSFQGSRGNATLIDFMPIDGAAPAPATGPDGDTQSRLIRILSCTAGEISGIFGRRAALSLLRPSVHQ